MTSQSAELSTPRTSRRSSVRVWRRIRKVSLGYTLRMRRHTRSVAGLYFARARAHSLARL